MTAQCGRITKANRMACNGVIHQVDRVLLPAELNAIETLKTQRDFSIFYRLLVVSTANLHLIHLYFFGVM